MACGVDRVFCIPGNSNLPLTDAMLRTPGIEPILVRHEEPAAFMASAHGNLTDTIGVCMSVAWHGDLYQGRQARLTCGANPDTTYRWS